MSIGISYDRWKNQEYGSIPDVVLACGPEDSLKNEFLKNLQERTDRSPELLQVYADETTPEDLIQELRGTGLFNERKWVVLKNLHQKQSGGSRELARYKAILEDYLDDPEPNTKLFLFDADHPYRQSRQTGSVARAVESVDGWAIVFWEPFDDSLRKTIKNHFSDAGLDFSAQAIQRILERTQGKYSRIVAEVDKITDVVDEKVSVEDVESLVSREEASDSFQSLKYNFVEENLSAMIRDFDEFWRRNESPPRVIHVLYEFLDDLRSINRMIRDGISLEESLSQRGRPTSREVMNLYEKGLKWVRKGLPRSFYRDAYGTEKNSKYAGGRLSELSLEMYALSLATRN